MKTNIFIFFIGLLLIVLSSFSIHTFLPALIMMDVTEDATFIASDGAAFDTFGWDVDISGDYAIVGAPNHNTNGNSNQGKAYIFHRENGIWTEQEQLFDPNGAANEDYGYSVGIDGDYAIVGAYEHSQMEGGDVFGKAYIYIRNGTNWTLQEELEASDGATDDWFGFSVDISGDYAIVGARFHNTNDNADQGKAYIFHRSGMNWTEQDILVIEDGEAGDNFGFSVAISGDYAAVGAHNPNINRQGEVFVYHRNAMDWEQQAALSAGISSDWFATSVDIFDEWVIAGAPRHDTNGNNNQGKAYLFQRFGTSWSAIPDTLTASDGTTGDAFGTSVAITENYAVVGANHHATDGDFDRGKAYIYKLISNNAQTVWLEENRPVASDGVDGDEFGFSVAISDTNVIVGARYFDREAVPTDDMRAGKVYMYEIAEAEVSMTCEVAAVGLEQLVNTETDDNESTPAIAHDANGNFVVVWQRSTNSPSYQGEIRGQRFDNLGQPIGAEFVANTNVDFVYTDLDVAMDSAGNFVVVWNVPFLFDDTLGVYARRYDNLGTPLGIDTTVNTDPGSGLFESVAVAMTSGGDYVVAWSEPYGGEEFVRAQRFDSDGNSQGGEISVATASSFSIGMDMNDSGDFNIIWYDFDTKATNMQRYNADGTVKDGSPITASTTALPSNDSPVDIALSEDGSFVAILGNNYQRYDANGNMLDETFFSGIETIDGNESGTFALTYGSATKLFNSDGTESQDIDAQGQLALLNNGHLIAAFEKTVSSDQDIYIRRFVCTDANGAIVVACGYTEAVEDIAPPSTFDDYSNCGVSYTDSDRIYKFEPTETSDIAISFQNGSIANLILLSDYSENACLASGNPITVNNLAPGTYFIVIERAPDFIGGTLTLTCSSSNPVCEDDDLIITETIADQQSRHASQKIIATNTITASGDAIYTAGDSVVLKEGFSAMGSFHAYIANCDFPPSNTTVEFRETDRKEAAHADLKLFPNPTNATTTVRFYLPESTNTNLQIIDINGKSVYTKNLSKQQSGWHDHTLDVSKWSSGIYFIKLSTASEVMAKKLSVIKD